MTQVNNSLAPQGQGRAPATFSAFITSEGVKARINEMMGGKEGQRFTTSIVSAVTNNPELAKCDHMSIFSAAMLGESLNLSPSTQLGQFYMVPFNDRKNGRKVATFQIGYKGYIQLAIRSGQYKKLNVLAIKKGELKHYDPLFEELKVELIQDDMQREQTPTIGYYAMFEYLNGFRKTMYWSKEKMEAHAKKYSQGYAKDLSKGWSYSFWSKDFDGMAYKTMLRQIISKWGIMSVEMQQAMAGDHAMIVNGEPQYIDTDPIPQSQPETEQPPQGQRPTTTAEPAKTMDQNQKSAEEALFGSDNSENKAEPTEDELAASVFDDGGEEYVQLSAADKKKKMSSCLKAYGVMLPDMEKLVNKSYAQWSLKERTTLLKAFRALSLGEDPAAVFPTQ